ncbi:hypothetical protein GW17_00008771 [Ensete ventricosum]|nr:hypothetical protein GW17_00008771 [Ensete ventricosum]
MQRQMGDQCCKRVAAVAEAAEAVIEEEERKMAIGAATMGLRRLEREQGMTAAEDDRCCKRAAAVAEAVEAVIEEEERKMAVEAAWQQRWQSAGQGTARAAARWLWQRGMKMKATVQLLLHGLKVVYEDLGAGSEGRKMRQEERRGSQL